MIPDTMVFAYAAFNVSPYREEAAHIIETADSVTVPDLLFPELLHVACKWVDHASLPRSEALTQMNAVQKLVDEIIATADVMETALQLALERKHPAYDAVFAACAALQETRVVTYDRRMIASFPEYTVHASEIGSGRP